MKISADSFFAIVGIIVRTILVNLGSSIWEKIREFIEE